MEVSLFIQQWDASLSAELKKPLKKQLAAYVNTLLLNDFGKLVRVLYQVDVSEQKLKIVLIENKDKDAGELIADLLIKRQEEKTALRQSFPPAKDIHEDEQW